ncbi:glucose-6-phosphate dehydrogenase [Carpediemonas membranifera]|uniref:Glucose-6-phosphate 1-dehydrogenase n=1 Tax=Carpediemonas membranifera TaxID=201153 RepID=A0A8J6AX56_9EUKA|nr:glucose-6-phosphate dehydrogenase [Carpediemonas membranifera]|eukprot:KAG9389479.1 glucose-6-phosphate dehydrogenase [Carpediemonas membranifera]
MQGNNNMFTSIVVVGASGDLAKKKVIPALFSLFHDRHIAKENSTVVGYARSKMTDDDLRGRIAENLVCRLKQEDQRSCGDIQTEFLNNLHYVSGSYDSAEDIAALDSKLKELESGHEKVRRLFYLAIPPSVFTDVAHLVHLHARAKQTVLVVEKPFGHDLASFEELNRTLQEDWKESEIYRIDHYLGKEVIQNLIVLRFANILFNNTWNRDFIKKVEISFNETIDVKGRGGYFDSYGIVRDVIQNHLIQILGLVAMERPLSMESGDIVAEKNKVLRSTTIDPSSVVVAQYEGYTADPTVEPDSKTPTFSRMTARINNERWAGVPFTLTAGKALDRTQTSITIHYRSIPGEPLFNTPCGNTCNRLSIIIQPDERIELRTMNKVPGMGFDARCSDLNMLYRDTYKGVHIPEAYERLILDVIEGDQRFFVQSGEARLSWVLFEQTLKEIDDGRFEVKTYPFGAKEGEI